MPNAPGPRAAKRPRLCRGASGTRRPVPFNPPRHPKTRPASALPPHRTAPRRHPARPSSPAPAADRREAANRPSLNRKRGVSPGRMSRPCSRAQPGGRKRECTSERSQDGEANARRIGLGSPRATPNARRIGLGSPRATPNARRIGLGSPRATHLPPVNEQGQPLEILQHVLVQALALRRSQPLRCRRRPAPPARGHSGP